MRIKKIKKERPYISRKDDKLGIQTYGEDNSFPQQVLEITSGSGTGSSCLDVYKKFVAGKGFEDKVFFGEILNRKGETADKILSYIVGDLTTFRGIYLHLNYNANYKISEINHVPFETARLGKPNEQGKVDKILLHWDWARQFSDIRKWKKEDVYELDIFNPNPEIIKAQVEKTGGWEGYKGQIYFYNETTIGSYPVPKYFAALTDMSTEQGLSNLSYRNTRHGFRTGGLLVDILAADPENEEQENETERNLMEAQGDEDACKIIYSTADSKEEVPIFIPFESKNYDKDFSTTDSSVRGRIGRIFNQPAILRSEDVGSNFGANALKNAYDFYNSVTENERLSIERIFAEIFALWARFEYKKFQILPLSYNVSAVNIEKMPPQILSTLTVNEKRALMGYDELQGDVNSEPVLAEKIGVGGTQSIVQIVSDGNMSDEQKKGVLKVLFSLSDEDVNIIIPDKVI